MCFRCRRLLRKNIFYPEYVDMETEKMQGLMEMEMRKLLDEDLYCYINTAINTMCKDKLFYHLTFRPVRWRLKTRRFCFHR